MLILGFMLRRDCMAAVERFEGSLFGEIPPVKPPFPKIGWSKKYALLNLYWGT
jgi:hypothetical protein